MIESRHSCHPGHIPHARRLDLVENAPPHTAALLIAAIALALCAAPVAVAADRPNVILILADQMNPRMLSSAGHPTLQTPNLDRLASEGIRFRNAYSNAPICVPSRASIHLGKYPLELGLLGNSMQVKEGEDRSLARLLSEAGWRVGISGKSHLRPRDRVGYGTFVDMQHRLTAGVTNAHPEHWYGKWLEARHAEDPLRFPAGRWRSFEQLRKEEWVEDLDRLRGTSRIPLAYYPARLITDRALEFIEEEEDTRPFFLFASYYIPHHPYFPPEPYADRYSPQDVVLPANFHATSDERPTLRSRFPDERLFSEDEFREVIAAYYGLIALLDDEIGRLLRGLEERGLLDNSLILFTADHGDLMGEFGGLFKGSMYEASVRVPLIVRPPGGAAHHARVDSHVVELVDLLPTILDFCAVARPAGLRGQSLAPLLRDPNAPWEDEAFSIDHRLGGVYRIMLREGARKLSIHGWRGHKEHWGILTYPDTDPYELENRFAEQRHLPEVHSMEKKLLAWFADQQALEGEAARTAMEASIAERQRRLTSDPIPLSVAPLPFEKPLEPDDDLPSRSDSE